MTRVATREERLYRLNGRLSSIKRQLGSAINESRMICNANDTRYRELSALYDMLKKHTDKFWEDYLK